MQIDKISPEMAADLIALVNKMKGIKYNASVDYTSKRTGVRTKFDYVTLDKIYALIKEDDNFALMQPLGTNDAGESALQVVLIHKSGETLVSDYYRLRVPEGTSKQDEGAAITYTKRYALGSFLGICTDEDNDANPDGQGIGLGAPNKPKSSPAKKAEPVDCPDGKQHFVCSDCGIAITKAMATLSERKFGKTLCPACQPEGD